MLTNCHLSGNVVTFNICFGCYNTMQYNIGIGIVGARCSLQ